MIETGWIVRGLTLLLGDRKEGALERQYAIAVARGPFGKEHKVAAFLQTLQNHVALFGHSSASTLDKDRALEFG